MATLDFTPLFRSSIGFDQLPSLLSHAMQRPELGFPPYNIEKTGEDQYRIMMAVAGFTKDQIEIVQEPNRLTVRGKLADETEKTYLHRGIANGTFERHFELADYVEVADATMGEGLLVIELKRELPEALKPKSIPINDGKFVPLGRKLSETPQLAA
jgi:molecular chaperone IbpA